MSLTSGKDLFGMFFDISGGVLVNTHTYRKTKRWFTVFANFCSVNTPTWQISNIKIMSVNMELGHYFQSQLLQVGKGWLQQTTGSDFKIGNHTSFFFFINHLDFCYYLCLYSKFSFQMVHNLFLQICKWIEHLGNCKDFYFSVNQVLKAEFLK